MDYLFRVLHSTGVGFNDLNFKLVQFGISSPPSIHFDTGPLILYKAVKYIDENINW
jgi:hypothetical protein